MNDKSNIQPRAKIMWYFEPRIERKKSRYRSTFLVRLLGSKYFIILALVGYLLFILICWHPDISFANNTYSLHTINICYI